MSTDQFLVAHAANPSWGAALDDCLRQVHAASDQPDAATPTLGWCYFSDYYAADSTEILVRLRTEMPGIAWVGTCGIGVAAGGTEYFDQPAMVLMLAPLARDTFRIFHEREPLAERAQDFVPHTALVHAQGSTPELQRQLHELAGRTETGYLFGGLASGRGQTLHIADGVFSGGLSGVAFGPEVGLVSRVTQGCQPYGPARTVTRCERNFVLTLDDRPALDCLLDDVGLGDDLSDQTLLNALSATLVGLSRGESDLAARPGQFGPETLVRHLVGIDPEHRVLAIADTVEPGMHMTFSSRDPQAALSDVERIANEVRAEVDKGPSLAITGALYVSCCGRGGPHFGAPNAEMQVLSKALGHVPLAGFFAGGEIARDHLYGYTGVLTVFTAPR